MSKDFAACSGGFMFAENLEAAGKPEFGRKAPDDVGKEGVERAEEEARHPFDKENEEFLVVAFGEPLEDGKEGVLFLVGDAG